MPSSLVTCATYLIGKKSMFKFSNMVSIFLSFQKNDNTNRWILICAHIWVKARKNYYIFENAWIDQYFGLNHTSSTSHFAVNILCSNSYFLSQCACVMKWNLNENLANKAE